jgi:hypothetical protein
MVRRRHATRSAIALWAVVALGDLVRLLSGVGSVALLVAGAGIGLVGAAGLSAWALAHRARHLPTRRRA